MPGIPFWIGRGTEQSKLDNPDPAGLASEFSCCQSSRERVVCRSTDFSGATANEQLGFKTSFKSPPSENPNGGLFVFLQLCSYRHDENQRWREALTNFETCSNPASSITLPC